MTTTTRPVKMFDVGFIQPNTVFGKRKQYVANVRETQPDTPDYRAIREALPAKYRPAFDRASERGLPSPMDDGKRLMRLKTVDGEHINTLLIVPFVQHAEHASA